MVKKSLFLCLFLVTCAFSSHAETIKIVYNSGTPPLKFTDKDKKANGMLIDIWKLWAKKAHQDIEFIEASWKDTLLMIKDGHADVHGGLYYTKDRDEYLDYTSNPLFENKNYFFYHKDIKGINSNQDILPFIVGVGNGFPRKFMKENYANVITKQYDSNAQVIEAIKSKELKVILNSLVNFTYSLKINQINIDDFKYIAQKPAFVKQYFGAVQSGNKKLLKIINDGFNNISQKELKEIELKWTKNLDISRFIKRNEQFKLNNDSQKEIQLTQKEQQYLKKNSIIQIAVMKNWTSYDMSDKYGNHIGLHNDLIDLLSNKTGIHYHIIVYNTWKEAYDSTIKGDTHGILGLSWSKERDDKYFDYSMPYSYTTYKLIVSKNTHDITNIKSINNRNIALVSKSITSTIIKKYNKNTKITYSKSIKDVYKLIQSGDVIATLSNEISKEDLAKYNLKIVDDIKDKANEIYMGVSHKYPIVYSIVQKSFDILTMKEIGELRQKWFNTDVKISLTEEEKLFVHNNKTIKIVANPAWPPFDFINKKTNQPDGIAADYIKLIAQRTGLKFKYIKASSWDESIQRIKDKELDIFGVIKKTPKREKYLKFTDTYITFPMVAVTKNEITFVGSIEDIQGKRFAMIKNFSSTEYLKTNYPNIKMTLYKNAKECMDAVSKNKADVFIGSLGTVSFLFKQQGYVNLKIAGKIGIESSWGIGVRSDIKPELISIFNKALHSITSKEKDEILNKWISIKFESEIDYTLLYQIVGLFIFFLAGTLYWNRKLSIAKKTVDESEIKTRSIVENSQDALIVINSDSQVVMWNYSATTIFGFTHDEMIGNSIDVIIPKGLKKSHFKGVQRVINGGEQKLLAKGVIEIEGLCKNGTVIPIDLSLNSYVINGEIFFSANIRDISDRKALMLELEEDKQLIDSVVNAQESFVLTTDGKILKSANHAFFEFFNIKTVEEFVEQFGNCICDTFDTTASSEYLQKIIDGEKWVDYVYDRPDEIHKALIQRNGKAYIFTVTSERIIFKGEELKVAVLTDVTDMEKARTDIEKTNTKVNTLLNNAGQGFLYFNKDMIIGNECSKEVMRIFNEDIRDKDITTFLYKDKDEQLFLKETLISILDDSPMKQDILISLLENEFKINNKFIEVEYKVLNKNNFMMILTDITAQKDLDKKVKEEHQVLKMIVEIVTTKEQFLEIKKDYEKLIKRIDSFKVLEKLAELRREIHTYKGLFAQKEMLYVVQKLHDFETIIDMSIKAKKIDTQIQQITEEDMYSWLELDIHIVKDILGEDYFDKSDYMSINKYRIDLLYKKVSDYFKSNTLEDINAIAQDIKELKYHNIKVFFRPFQKLVEQLAQRLNKPLNPLIVNSEDIYLPDTYQAFLNSLVHIFRNSVDHGIETLELRYDAGKVENGTIICDIVKDDKSIMIKISDDGKGIDIKKIKSLAIQKGVYTKEEIEKLTQQEILLIIFQDAFTTSDTITDISGRGVGLASILSELNKLDGSMFIENKFGKGIEFKFDIPLK